MGWVRTYVCSLLLAGSYVGFIERRGSGIAKSGVLGNTGIN